MKKLILIALLPFAVTVAQAADTAGIEERYSKTCALCHASGAANAPKTGVSSDWTARMEKGMDTLVQNVENGLNAMPPKGMCMDCSADDFKALIEYMAGTK